MALRPVTLNPVLRRELLERWRGKRAFAVVSAYLGLLVTVIMLLTWAMSSFLRDTGQFTGISPLDAGPMLGRAIFENLLAFVLLFTLFITPAYAAAQISGERERRTLGLLQVTLVRPSQIVAGKLGASVAWVVLLVLASAPLAATSFFLGGVTITDFVRGVTLILVVAVSVASLAIGISTLTRKTTASIVLTYGVVLTLLLGTLFGAVIEAAARRFEFTPGSRPLSLYANPYFGLADAVEADRFSVFSELPSALTPFAFMLPDPQVRFFDREPVDEMTILPLDDVAFERRAVIEEQEFLRAEMQGRIPPEVAFDRAEAQGFLEPVMRSDRQPVWLVTMAVYLLLGALGFALGTRGVQPGRGPALRRRRPGPVTIEAGVPPTDPVAETLGLTPVDPTLIPPPAPPPDRPGGNA